ncbi:MAG: rRNA pseudouridine synthase [Acholeplasmatales bacterium]|jgi:23S rRNA pseudouridine2605 synthase|nr:rRNA pseudouridine synthase [Acholeplasmatales bacterium]
MERLNKVLSKSNVASRRASDKLILEGKIKVNGVVVTTLGTKISSTDTILVDNKPIAKSHLVYYLLNKPTGYISSTKDEKGRKTVLDLINVSDKVDRLYPVGRLDYDSEGLIIITNDGILTKFLTHPMNMVEKEYTARIEGLLKKEEIALVKKGVLINNSYLAKPKSIKFVKYEEEYGSSIVTLVLTEGKYHEVRDLFLTLGHKVLKLTRTRYDNLTIDIKKGEYRPLTPHEIKNIYRNVK